MAGNVPMAVMKPKIPEYDSNYGSLQWTPGFEKRDLFRFHLRRIACFEFRDFFHLHFRFMRPEIRPIAFVFEFRNLIRLPFRLSEQDCAQQKDNDLNDRYVNE